jgi:hypothetical protein
MTRLLCLWFLWKDGRRSIIGTGLSLDRVFSMAKTSSLEPGRFWIEAEAPSFRNADYARLGSREFLD